MPSLNYGTFQLDQLPLQPENGASLLWVKLLYLLFLLSVGETSCHQTALNPGILTSLEVMDGEEDCGTFGGTLQLLPKYAKQLYE